MGQADRERTGGVTERYCRRVQGGWVQTVWAQADRYGKAGLGTGRRVQEGWTGYRQTGTGRLDNKVQADG